MSERLYDSYKFRWQSKAGVHYQVEETRDRGRTWTNHPELYVGNGAIIESAVILGDAPDDILGAFRLIGAEVGAEIFFLAIVAWDASSVLLQWFPIAATIAGNRGYKVYRNTQLLATLPPSAGNYRDTTIVSGQRYSYEVKYFAS